MGGRAGVVLPGSACQFFQGLTARLRKAVRIATANEYAKVATDWEELGIPPVVEHVWEWFWQLDQSRGRGMALEPLSFSDIEAWTRLYGETVRPWEARCITAMDGARLAETARQSDPNAGREVPASDTAGVRAIMNGLKGRQPSQI